MKNIGMVVLAVAASIVLGSCVGKEKKTPFEYREVNDEAALSRDTTVYGICGDGSAMNTLQLFTDSGDTLNLSLVDARDNDRCFGGYSSGDRMAVLLADNKTANMVINLSALLGNWVMPNPLDGSSETGMRIKEGGIVEGIDQSTIVYKSWRIFNGQLEIVLVREGGGDEEETNLYDLISLGADSLVIKDVADGDRFEYSRQQEHHYDTKVQLEPVEQFDI